MTSLEENVGAKNMVWLAIGKIFRFFSIIKCSNSMSECSVLGCAVVGFVLGLVMMACCCCCYVRKIRFVTSYVHNR